MDVKRHLLPILTNKVYVFLFFTSLAIIPRALIWAFLPLDWNLDSYHHWQISYLTLKIGLRQGRMWDLNGCEYYWGMVPHLVQAFLLWVFNTASIAPYRALNVLLGGVNTYLLYLIGRDNLYWEVGLYAGLLFALYPVAAVFDIIAMQETLALFLALLSIHLFRTRPFWSGVFLALACQSRIEFWMVSIIFVVAAVLIERASTRLVPFIVAWLLVTGVFCWFFAAQTGNAIYPLYWSLYNFFGGWTESGWGKPLLELISRWAFHRLKTWPTTPSGIVLLGSMFGVLIVLVHMILRRWRRYHLYLFLMAVLVVFGPLFVPYFGKRLEYLLLMLRMSIPVAALGYAIVVYQLLRIRLPIFQVRLSRLHVEKILLLVTLLSYTYFILAYGRFQSIPNGVFSAADEGIKYYRGGTILCDYPILNYRLVSKWHIKAKDLLGAHYSPASYGIEDPIEYAKWLDQHNITSWIYRGEKGKTEWLTLNENFPDLLVYKYAKYEMQFYVVNKTAIKLILAG